MHFPCVVHHPQLRVGLDARIALSRLPSGYNFSKPGRDAAEVGRRRIRIRTHARDGTSVKSQGGVLKTLPYSKALHLPCPLSPTAAIRCQQELLMEALHTLSSVSTVSRRRSSSWSDHDMGIRCGDAHTLSCAWNTRLIT